MAKCTLDDLVPSIKCKRVFLEPLGTSYSEYEVQIEACVYDTIEDEDDGIVDYLLTDTFLNNVMCVITYCRDASIENSINFLRIRSNLEEWQVTYFVNEFVTESEGNFDGMSDDEIREFIEDEYSITIFSLPVLQRRYGTEHGLDNPSVFAEFIDTLVDIGKAWRDGRIEYKVIEFSNYSTPFIQNHYANYGENYGEITQDDDGNPTYELLLPREEFKFTNSTAVKHCYAHMTCHMNIAGILEDAGLSMSSLSDARFREVMRYSVGKMNTCRILEEGRVASPVVQDFRLSERIAEIIQPNRITTYDDFIDKVSLMTSQDLEKEAISTELLLSYRKERTGPMRTRRLLPYGRFFIQLDQLLTQNTKHRFIYQNLMPAIYSGQEGAFELGMAVDEITSNMQIIKLHVYRTRVDKKGEYHRQKIADLSNGGYQYGGQKYIRGFTFEDNRFKTLTDGVYSYEIELEAVDPIYDFVEDRVNSLKYAISLYKRAIEYIHNNPQNYNEIRDTLNEDARASIIEILEKPSTDGTITIEIWRQAFYDLFLMFTGVSLEQEEQDTFDDMQANAFAAALIEFSNHDTVLAEETEYAKKAMAGFMKFLNIDIVITGKMLQRRMIENHLRVMEDLMFAIGKFFEIDAMNSKSASSIQSSRELIKYHRKWDNEVSPRFLSAGAIKIVEDAVPHSGYTLQEYRTRMRKELEIYGLESTYSEYAEFGSMSPVSIDGIETSPEFQSDIFLSLFSNLLEMGKVGDRELQYYQQLMDTGVSSGTKFEKSANDIKNNSGLFETFLANLGATCDNTTSQAFSKYPNSSNFKGKKSYSRAIDDGENLFLTQNSQHGESSSETSADEEDLTTEEHRNAVKEELFLEAKKKEDLIMRMIIHRDGYSVMDRKEFVQGEHQKLRYTSDFDFTNYWSSNSRPFPIGWQTNNGKRILNNAFNGTNAPGSHTHVFNPPRIPLHRFLVDNTHLVYYLKRIHWDGTLVWAHLTDLSRAQNSNAAEGTNGLVLCKLKRYQNSDLKIGQGSSSDREIIGKYFYVQVGN